jgi:ParB-like chromosome segregation protein Spo0J
VEELRKMISAFLESAEDKPEVINALRRMIHEMGPCPDMPTDLVLLIPIEKIEANDYNPNSVARIEMGLLLKSIEHDGYTQPAVTIYDSGRDRYIIVDGFHRYFVMKANKEIYDRYHGLLPVTVIEKDINDRMASTIRHNRARGKHSVDGMANMVFKMLDNGMDDASICNELGMEPEELLRLKHITGFSRLFADREYNKSWVTKNQIQIRRAYKAGKAASELEHGRD